MLRALLSIFNRLLLRLVSVTKAPLTYLLLKTDEEIIVGYWKIRGLGAPLRMMCEYAGASYRAENFEAVEKPDGGYDLSSWFAARKPGLLERNALTNLPFVEAGGTVIAQSNACLTFLGRRFSLLGATEEDLHKNEQCLAQVMDLRNDAISLFYGGFGPDKRQVFDARKEAHYEGKARGHYAKLEAWLGQQGTLYLVGESPQAADFHLWEMLDQHEELGRFLGKASLLEDFPRLKKLYGAFRELPQLQGYFEGPLHALPINNKMAVFGSQPSA
mmetsp:Transcript_10967/g.37313  ORF Transcript_10967/g.37313 Transcript_10967/m.37313 type:complete len:273 (-) Transcript_10967:197-1015(-)